MRNSATARTFTSEPVITVAGMRTQVRGTRIGARVKGKLRRDERAAMPSRRSARTPRGRCLADAG